MKGSLKKQKNMIYSSFAFVMTGAMIIMFTGLENANAFERKVLFEDYTSTTCPPCAAAADAVEEGLEQVGDDLVASIAIHVWWPAPGNDPWYLDNPDENRTRTGYYGINAVPTYEIDGEPYGGQRAAAAFAGAIVQRSRVDSPLEIELRPIIIGNVLNVATEITASADLDRVNLYIALVEDYVRYNAPTGQRDHYDAMIKFVTSDMGLQFNIEDGENVNYFFETDLEGLGWHELETDNLTVIAWVQGRDREVHQSQNFLSLSEINLDMDFTEAEDADGDGRLEPGESGEITFTLENGENSPDIRNMTVTLSADDEEIELETVTFIIESLESGDDITNADVPLSFSVPEDFEARPVNFSIEFASEANQILFVKEFNRMVGWPPLLVVDASESLIAGEKIMEHFGEIDLPWADNLNRASEGILTAELAENYDVILWHTFTEEEDILIDFEEDVLVDFLDNGGTVIFSSVAFVRGWEGSELMRDYFATGLAAEDIAERFLHGSEDAPYFNGANLFLGGGDGAGMPTSSPDLAPLDGAREIMNWGNVRIGENNGIAGTVHETDTYRTMLLAFPIESIGGHIGTDERISFMRRIWNWYTTGSAGIPDGGEIKPLEFSLYPAFPNPFNSESVISFSLDAASDVNLSLYDLTGREVHKLLNSNLQNGYHKVILNAFDAGLVNGVYYINLKTDQKTASQKVLYLR